MACTDLLKFAVFSHIADIYWLIIIIPNDMKNKVSVYKYYLMLTHWVLLNCYTKTQQTRSCIIVL